MIKRILFLGWFALLLFLTGCGQNETPPAALVTSQAPVDTVQVSPASGASAGWQVEVHGNLPDGCTRLGDPVLSMGDGLVVIILPAYRSAGQQDCASAAQFEQTIPLPAALAPGRYSVSVNGVQASFVVPDPSPTATPTLEPSPTATADLPTPEPAAPPPDPAPTLLPTLEAIPGTGSAVPTPTQVPGPATGNPDCEIKGAFFSDLTVPDGTVFNPGEKFTKSWRIRNAGTCVWQGYGLVFQRGDAMGSSEAQPLPGKVDPGGTVDISIDFTAPQAPGMYFSDWLLSTADGRVFGLGNPSIGLLWLKIGVRSPLAANPPPVVDPLPETGGAATEDTCGYQTDAADEAQVLALINAARSERGLAPFQLVDPLSAAARLHAADMACHDFVDHYGYDGSTWLTRIKAQGVRYRSASENIYAGNPAFGGTPQGAFNWWMNSQIHRENILNPKATQIGIGYVYAAGSTYKGYYTLNFVQP